METKTISGITTKEISRELLYEGYTKKIECKNYWDSHGKRVDYADTQHKFDCEKKFELWSIKRETTYSSIPDYIHQDEDWYLMVDGKMFEIEGWIMEYNHLKTKLKLDCCVGAG